jgi:hypothetical protein
MNPRMTLASSMNHAKAATTWEPRRPFALASTVTVAGES